MIKDYLGLIVAAGLLLVAGIAAVIYVGGLAVYALISWLTHWVIGR
jgi:hypothetical protein